MPEKFDPRKFKSYEELPEEQKPQFKPVEGGFVEKTVIENPAEAREEAEKNTDTISEPSEKPAEEVIFTPKQRKIMEKRVIHDAKLLKNGAEFSEKGQISPSEKQKENFHKEMENLSKLRSLDLSEFDGTIIVEIEESEGPEYPHQKKVERAIINLYHNGKIVGWWEYENWPIYVNSTDLRKQNVVEEIIKSAQEAVSGWELYDKIIQEDIDSVKEILAKIEKHGIKKPEVFFGSRLRCDSVSAEFLKKLIEINFIDVKIVNSIAGHIINNTFDKDIFWYDKNKTKDVDRYNIVDVKGKLEVLVKYSDEIREEINKNCRDFIFSAAQKEDEEKFNILLEFSNKDTLAKNILDLMTDIKSRIGNQKVIDYLRYVSKEELEKAYPNILKYAEYFKEDIKRISDEREKEMKERLQSDELIYDSFKKTPYYDPNKGNDYEEFIKKPKSPNWAYEFFYDQLHDKDPESILNPLSPEWFEAKHQYNEKIGFHVLKGVPPSRHGAWRDLMERFDKALSEVKAEDKQNLFKERYLANRTVKDLLEEALEAGSLDTIKSLIDNGALLYLKDIPRDKKSEYKPEDYIVPRRHLIRYAMAKHPKIAEYLEKMMQEKKEEQTKRLLAINDDDIVEKVIKPKK